MSVLGVTLNSFGGAMLNFVTQGQLEMFLVEPMPWRALPFALVPWGTFQAFLTSSLMVVLSIPLGAEYLLSGVPAAIVIVLLGNAATLSIGILGASIKVLSKHPSSQGHSSRSSCSHRGCGRSHGSSHTPT
jgi:hypothetical protein